MQTEHSPVPEEEATATPPPDSPDNGVPEDEDQIKSLLEQIRLRRRELSGDRKTYITIPGYDDLGLVAMYHLLDGKELDVITTRAQRQTRDRVERAIYMACDVMISACDGLYLDRGGSEYVPFDPQRRGEPFRYESALADFCGFEAETARQVVMGLFGNNDAALASHSFKLQRWFQDTMRDADEEFLGEL